MKFLKTYAVCLVISEGFLFCGGWMLFDFERRPFLTFAAIAFLIAVLIAVWRSQEERIDTMERRVRDFEERIWVLENRESKKDLQNKENDL